MTLTKSVEIIREDPRVDELNNLVDALLRHLLPETKKMTRDQRVERAKQLFGLGDKTKGLPEKKNGER